MDSALLFEVFQPRVHYLFDTQQRLRLRLEFRAHHLFQSVETLVEIRAQVGDPPNWSASRPGSP